MRKERERVGCGICKWRGARVRGECDCYDEYAMNCSCAWGRCPKCQSRVHQMSDIKLWRQQAREAARR